MTIETQQSVVVLKRIGAAVSSVLKTAIDSVEPGMTTAELDAIGSRLLSRFGTPSAPQVMS